MFILGRDGRGRIVGTDGRSIFVATDTGRGLGSLGFDWQKVVDLATPISAGFGTWLANKGAQQVPAYQPQALQPYAGGASFSASSSGLFGGIDTTTLVLIGLAVFLFLSKR